MKLHERFFIVENARNEAAGAFLDVQQKYELTYAETFSILAEILASKAKFCLRAERHPKEPSKGGDEA